MFTYTYIYKYLLTIPLANYLTVMSHWYEIYYGNKWLLLLLLHYTHIPASRAYTDANILCGRRRVVVDSVKRTFHPPGKSNRPFTQIHREAFFPPVEYPSLDGKASPTSHVLNVQEIFFCHGVRMRESLSDMGGNRSFRVVEETLFGL